MCRSFQLVHPVPQIQHQRALQVYVLTTCVRALFPIASMTAVPMTKFAHSTARHFLNVCRVFLLGHLVQEEWSVQPVSVSTEYVHALHTEAAVNLAAHHYKRV